MINHSITTEETTDQTTNQTPTLSDIELDAVVGGSLMSVVKEKMLDGAGYVQMGEYPNAGGGVRR